MEQDPKKGTTFLSKAMAYHQAAQLSALEALTRAFAAGAPLPEVIERFLEHILQVFEADGVYLELSIGSSSEKLRLALGSCSGVVEKPLFTRTSRPSLTQDATRRLGADAIKKGGWDQRTGSFLSVPIHQNEIPVGVLVLGKSAHSLFKEQELEELQLFAHHLALASERMLTDRTGKETIKHFVESFEDGVYLIDQKGSVFTVNRKGKALLGIKNKKEAIRALYRDPAFLNIRSPNGSLLLPEQLPLRQVLQGEAFTSAEYIVRRPGGQEDVHLSLSGGPIRNKKGEVSEGVLIAREITEFRLMEKALQKALANEKEKARQEVLAKEKEKERAKNAFFTQVSHELRTPLNAIIGYTALVLNGAYGEFPEEAKNAISRTYSNAKSLRELVDDLLTLSRTEAERVSLSVEKVSLVTLLHEVVSDAQPLLEGKPIEVFLQVEPDLPLIESDPRRVKKVFANLFANAIKYTLQGTVQIAAKNLSEEKQVRVDVVDTGIGIRESDLPDLFEEFHRIDDPLTRNIQGTGLGLAIVKKALVLLQGSIKVKSVYGEGSTFTVFLPYRLQDNPLSLKKQKKERRAAGI